MCVCPHTSPLPVKMQQGRQAGRQAGLAGVPLWGVGCCAPFLPPLEDISHTDLCVNRQPERSRQAHNRQPAALCASLRLPQPMTGRAVCLFPSWCVAYASVSTWAWDSVAFCALQLCLSCLACAFKNMLSVCCVCCLACVAACSSCGCAL